MFGRGPTVVVHRNESVLKNIFKRGYVEIRDRKLLEILKKDRTWLKYELHCNVKTHIFIIHNDHTYITGDYTKLYLNIICNRSFFYFEMMSALFRSEFYTRMKRYWGENISI
jgi:hypothetical protein